MQTPAARIQLWYAPIQQHGIGNTLAVEQDADVEENGSLDDREYLDILKARTVDQQHAFAAND